ncbi:MAG: septum formation initiator family protein [Firmicutes bacterium]|nr:septum formation initiator family protein [Bacillota bacterium]
MRAQGTYPSLRGQWPEEVSRSVPPRPPKPGQGQVVRRYWLYGVCLAAMAMAGLSLHGMFRAQEERLARLQAEEAALQAQLEAARSRNQALRREIERLQTDEYIETVARSQLGYVRPGEIPFMALDPKQGSSGNN